ncbi:hypothetical protein ACFOWZ_44055 [Lentzea rhizosphaerae]|uniref:Uncharacterized protein n=1 Tax=Lentzea rhizosphaerae TaxID=2041025 RepID=A0ABV8C8X6_9PSEU
MNCATAAATRKSAPWWRYEVVSLRRRVPSRSVAISFTRSP